MQHELEEVKDKITIHFNTSTDEILGDGKLVSKVIGTDKKSGKKLEFVADGVFVFIGLKPTTDFLKSSGVARSEIGFVITDADLKTNIDGIFAAGDVRDGATMQIASATGEGATAALKMREYLHHNR